MSAKAPTVTCHFAKGTNCTGCCLDYWPTDAPESTLHQYLNISRSPDSLEASGTIEGLVPGKTYMLKAYDIEWDGTTSTDIGVKLEGELSLGNERARGVQCIYFQQYSAACFVFIRHLHTEYSIHQNYNNYDENSNCILKVNSPCTHLYTMFVYS